MASAKSASRSGPNSRGSDPHADKRLTSGRISADISDFVKSGGKVEILGITRDWYKPSAPSARGNKSGKVAPTPAAAAKAPVAKAPAVKTAATRTAPGKAPVVKSAAVPASKPVVKKAASKAAAPAKAAAAPRKRSVAKKAKA